MDLNRIKLHAGQGNAPLEHCFRLPTITFNTYFETIDTVPNTKFYYLILFNDTRDIGTAHLITIPKDIQDSVIQGNCLILILCAQEGYPWNIYSNFIEAINCNYNFSNKHFVVVSNNPTQSTEYRSVFFNFWEYFSYSTNILKEISLGQNAVLTQQPRPYKFIALNRRCHAHRMAVFAKLYPYKDHGLLSFAKAGHFEQDLAPTFSYFFTQKQNFAASFTKIHREWYAQDLDNVVPLELDKDLDPYDHCSLTTNPINDEHSLKFYQSYLHIVIETSVHSVFFSEKTFKPVRYFQPFVLIGGAGSLKKLKELGYKTFEDYIDEGYDSILDNEKRIEYAVKSAVDFMMQDNLSKILNDMYHILKHNHETLISNSRNTLEKLVSDLTSELK